MKTHISSLQFAAIAVVAMIIGTTVSFTVPLTGQVQVITTPCTTTPCFNGDLEGGTDAPFNVPRDISLTELILRVISFILNVILIVAVLAIIIAGVYLIVGMGSESSKERAKNIVLYVIIGLLLILFARAIVLVFLNFFD